MKITTVTQFKTEDNQVHDSKLHAELHNLGLQMRSHLLEHFTDNGQLKQICLHMAKNSEVFAKIMIDGRRKIANARMSK